MIQFYHFSNGLQISYVKNKIIYFTLNIINLVACIYVLGIFDITVIASRDTNLIGEIIRIEF